MYKDITEQKPKETCPECGSDRLIERIGEQQFNYGHPDENVVLTASMPVTSCQDCGNEYFDERGEAARHAAVCKHLGVHTPQEIRQIREALELSRQDFAQLTGFGIASVQRWEAGTVIPNPSSDRLIYLLQFGSNVRLLQEREQSVTTTGAEEIDLPGIDLCAAESHPRMNAVCRTRLFPRLRDRPRLETQALLWSLRKS